MRRPRDLCDSEDSAGPSWHGGLCPPCATAEPRREAAKLRAVPARLPQSRPRDERRAPAPAPHGGAPRGGAPALRAGLGGAESGADQSARGAPPAARA